MPWKLMNVEGKQLFEDACVGGLTAEEMRADSERLFESRVPVRSVTRPPGGGLLAKQWSLLGVSH